MKLTRISKPLRSVQVRISLAGDLNAELERYASYYQHVHGEAVDSKTLIPEILHAFLEADREFQTWSRSECPEQSFHRRGWRLIKRHSEGAGVRRMARRSVDVLRTWNPLTRHSSLDERTLADRTFG